MKDKSIIKGIVALAAVCIIMMIFVAFFIVAGSQHSTIKEITVDNLNDRFGVVQDLKPEDTSKAILIIYDKETGVEYLYYKTLDEITITVLLNKDGKPLIYTGNTNK